MRRMMHRLNRYVPGYIVEGENGDWIDDKKPISIRWLSIKVSVVRERIPSGLVGNSIEQYLL